MKTCWACLPSSQSAWPQGPPEIQKVDKELIPLPPSAPPPTSRPELSWELSGGLRWLRSWEDPGLPPAEWERPRDKDFMCSIGLKPQETWMSGCGEGGAQEGVHKSMVDFLEEAGHLEAEERIGFIRPRWNFPEKTLLPRLCLLPSGHWGFCFHKARGRWPKLVVPKPGPARIDWASVTLKVHSPTQTCPINCPWVGSKNLQGRSWARFQIPP